MANVLSGKPRGSGVKVGIVCGRFNEFITKALLEGCEDELLRHDVDPDSITVVWVPGAWEIPLVTERLAASVDVVITLGAVIRGATAHFDYVAGEAAKGVAGVTGRTGKPVIFGILTTDTIEQAVERSGTKAGNKGRDSAIAALEMVDLLKSLPA